MKAIVATRFGEPAEVLELKTLPDPPSPGPGEVVVRVTKRAPGQFDVEADYDLTQFIDAIKHNERGGRDGAVLMSSNS